MVRVPARRKRRIFEKPAIPVRCRTVRSVVLMSHMDPVAPIPAHSPIYQ